MTLRRIEARGAVETAHRAKQACGQVFRDAIATGRAERDPTSDPRHALALLGMGHPLGLSSIGQIAEIVRPLRVEAGARLGPAHMLGLGSVCVAHLLSSPGELVGIVLANLASVGLAQRMQVRFLFNPGVNRLAFTFSAGIGALFGCFPARRAAQLDPIEALRHE